MDPTLNKLRQQLRDLDDQHRRGSLDAKAHAQRRAALEKQIADRVLAVPHADDSPEPARARKGMLAKLAAVVVLFGVAGYAWHGNPSLMFDGDIPVASGTVRTAPHAMGDEQMAGLVEQLAKRMEQQPDDVEGWVMLARSYASMGQYEKAVPAYRKALALRKDDAGLLADFADLLGVAQGRSLEGEPSQVIEQALKIDPNQLKALALAGTAAFNREDYKGALKHWEKMVAVGPADDPFVQQIQGGIDEARRRAGMAPATPVAKALAAQPAPAPATAQAGAGGDKPAAAGNGRVSGTVSLSPALKAQAAPEDTVFVFARPAEGSRMPLALVSRKVKELPFEFTLDDGNALSPAMKLSSQSRVIVGARVSKSGQAMTQPGDLQGLSAAVPLGANGVKIEITEVIKP